MPAFFPTNGTGHIEGSAPHKRQSPEKGEHMSLADQDTKYPTGLDLQMVPTFQSFLTFVLKTLTGTEHKQNDTGGENVSYIHTEHLCL